MKIRTLSQALLCALACVSGPVAAQSSTHEGWYIGAFGGRGASIATSLQQRGAVHLNAHLSLPINAEGSTSSSTHMWLAGMHAGHQWRQWKLGHSRWGLAPALELEGLYIGRHAPTGEMPVRPRALGMQYVTVPIKAGVLLANAVFTFDTPYSDSIRPYVGVGAGVASVSIKGSDSANPSEPGINHFNSDPDASDTAFAMQLKAGLKADINKKLSLFTEYRHLSINATRYTFGATDYPGLHLPTATWRVDMGRQKYNVFVAGLQYRY